MAVSGDLTFQRRAGRALESSRTFVKLLFRNRLTGAAFVVVTLLVVVALLAPVLAPYPDDGRGVVNPSERFQKPSSEHIFGTDDMGRDILSRVIFGTRISLSISLVTIVAAMLIAIPLGVIAGYFGGFIDEILMRITDVFLSFPPLLIAIVVASFLGPSLENAMIAIVIAWWPWYSRVIRAQVMAAKERPYVSAARCIGTSDWKIMFSHILPNTIAPVIIQASMDLGCVILTAASLSFIGLGAQPPQPEWGLIVSSARTYILDAWWYSVFPGLAILVTVLSFNLIGDGLREVLDPRTRVR
ncbi:MAG: ABC transporter permease [Bacillota bacterium]|nr:MAG: ABC transporter permease [Bacillota bacterium]